MFVVCSQELVAIVGSDNGQKSLRVRASARAVSDDQFIKTFAASAVEILGIQRIPGLVSCSYAAPPVAARRPCCGC